MSSYLSNLACVGYGLDFTLFWFVLSGVIYRGEASLFSFWDPPWSCCFVQACVIIITHKGIQTLIKEVPDYSLLYLKQLASGNYLHFRKKMVRIGMAALWNRKLCSFARLLTTLFYCFFHSPFCHHEKYFGMLTSHRIKVFLSTTKCKQNWISVIVMHGNHNIKIALLAFV